MEKAGPTKQRFFVERDLFFQTLTLLLTVLLGGFLLLLLSKTISGYVDSSVLFLMLFVGYFLLIIFFAWSLSTKFIGPFGRLKENMQEISAGDLTVRLSVRQGDDIRIKHFVEEANRMIASVNQCLEQIKGPCHETQVLSERVLSKLKTDSDTAREECLPHLEALRDNVETIAQLSERFKTAN